MAFEFRYADNDAVITEKSGLKYVKVWGEILIGQIRRGRTNVIKKKKPQYSFCGFRLQHYFIIAI